MNPLFIYLLKASATVFILWAFYVLCLRRMTFHRLNRYFFLTGILVSLLWPSLPLTEWFSKATQVNQVVVYIPVSTLMMQFKPETPTFGLEMALKIAYFAGLLFMLVRLSIQIFSLRDIFKKSEIRVINDVEIHVVKGKINPFSFFGYIFLNPSNHTPTELSAIILHEKVHESRTHSVDILLSELFKILLWFNPFSWLFCRAIKENTEFEVDRALLHQGIDCKEYQYSLLKLSVIKNQIVITNHFNLSNLKTRIIMMNKNQSSRYGLATYALVIPLILICMIFSYAFAQEKSSKADSTLRYTIVKQKVENVPENALIILDGKVIDKAKMDAMNPDDIYAVNVLKGKGATSIYGRKGKNGVVLITSKKESSVRNSTVIIRMKDSTGMIRDAKPLIFVDGVQMNEDAIKDMNPDQIESIDVVKNENSTKEYGEKGGNGVIKITVKKNISHSSGEGKSVSYSTDTQTTSDGKTSSVTKIYSLGEGKGESTVKVITNDSDNSDETTAAFSKDENSTINFSPKGAYILLDGKEIDEAKLNSVKPDEIEKIEVLKGESATTLYGKKGEKGVILITLKKK